MIPDWIEIHPQDEPLNDPFLKTAGELAAKERLEEPVYFVGLDLGQSVDYC
jgi:hypothetical protein